MPDYTVSTQSSPASKAGVYTLTTDATQTVAWTHPTVNNAAYRVEAFITCVNTGNYAQAGTYHRRALVVNNGGSAAIVGSVRTVETDDESVVGWDATIDVSGTTIRVLVTGANATNLTWLVDVKVTRVSQYIAGAGRVA